MAWTRGARWLRVVFRCSARLHLLGPSGLATAGAPVIVNGRPVLIYASLKYVIADLGGHRMAWNSNGANGFRPCLRHCNVLKKNSGTVDVDPAFVEITCSDTVRFGANTCADVYRNADALIEARARVAAGAMTQTRFKNLEKVFGLKCAPRGVLVDRDLRGILDVVDSSVIDWVHTALQDGTFTIDVTLLVQRVGATLGITFDDVASFLQDGWFFPAWGRAKSNQLFRVFDPRRSPDEDKVKASASELLGLYSLLRHFVELYLLDVPETAKEATSFRAACATIDVITLVKQGRLSLAEGAVLLRRTHSQHMRLHIDAYGEGHIVPKHHFMYDVADQWERRSVVIDAFVVERLHLRVKHIMDPIRNTRQFEESCLSSLINAHILSLQKHKFCDTLVGHTSRLPGSAVPMSDQMVVKGMTTTVGDIVILDGVAGKVCACARDGDEFFALVNIFVHISVVTAHSDRWRAGDRIEAWPADALLSASAWYTADNDTVVLRIT